MVRITLPIIESERKTMTKPNDATEDFDAFDCSSSCFSYRGIGFQRTSKGYWFFDSLPPCGNAWQRYGTDEETKAISDVAISVQPALSIMHRMVDRALSRNVVYQGDLRYR